MSTSTTHVQHVQAAYYAHLNPDRTTAQVARKFSITASGVDKSVSRLQNGKLLEKKKGSWSSKWDNGDHIFHADDTYLHTAFVTHSDKKSVLMHGLFDADYDPINGGMHYQWSENEVDTLLQTLPYRILEILRDSKPGSADYEEAVLMMDSDLFKAVCKKYGLDYEFITVEALLITKADL